MALEKCAEVGEFYDSTTDETGLKINAQRLHVTGKITTDTPLLTTAQNVADAINELFTGGSGGGDEWQPPADWIPVPEPAENEIHQLVQTNNERIVTVEIGRTGVGTIDWGDGTTESISNNLSHTYSEVRKQYLIKATFTDYSNLAFCRIKTNIYTQSSDDKTITLIVKYGDNIFCADANSVYYTWLNYYWGDNLLEARISDKRIIFGALSNMPVLQKVVIPNAEIICENAFYDCSSLRKIDLSSVQEIQMAAFSRCMLLKAVQADNCAIVGDSAFNTCYSLESATFATGCTFSSSAFSNCFMLNPKPN